MIASPNLAAALELVREGLIVFPCKPDKTPHVQFLSVCSNNEGVIRSWWEKWPDALPALPCGANGLFVVDCDRKDAGVDGVAGFLAGCAASGVDLSEAYAVDTPSSGRHYYFRCDPASGLGNTVSKLGPGIDTRGAGGYVVAPGAVLPDGRAYRPLLGTLRAIVGVPEPIAGFLALPQPTLQREQISTAHPITDGDRAYALAALEGECNALRSVRRGRNAALCKAAFTIGGHVGNGSLDRTLAEDELRSAATENGYVAKDGVEEANGTINSGMSKGMQSMFPVKSQQFGLISGDSPLRASIERKLLAVTAPTRVTDSPAPSAPFSALDLDTIPSVFSYDSRDMEFAVPGLIPCGAVTMISGDSGCGKTTFITAMADRVARGEPFLGFTPGEPRKCLYLDRENSIAAVQERLRRLKVTDGNNFKYFGAHVGEVPMPGANVVRDWVAKTNPKPVIFVDSVIAFLEGNENSSTDVRSFMQPIRDLANLGAAVVMLHHTGKGETTQEYRGSSDWKAAIDVGYTMRNLGESRLTNLSMKSFKARFIVSDVVAITYRYGVFSAEDIPQAAEDGLTQLLRESPEVTKGEFEKMAAIKGFTRTQVRKFIDDGSQAGKVRLLVGRNNAQRIRLSEGEAFGMIV